MIELATCILLTSTEPAPEIFFCDPPVKDQECFYGWAIDSLYCVNRFDLLLERDDPYMDFIEIEEFLIKELY